MKELTNEQIARMDEIENAVHELCKVMLENYELEWNMGIIGDVADAVVGVLVDKGYKVRFPAFVYPDGCIEDGEIVDWCRPIDKHSEDIKISLMTMLNKNKNKRKYNPEALDAAIKNFKPSENVTVVIKED